MPPGAIRATASPPIDIPITNPNVEAPMSTTLITIMLSQENGS
jgi:hypothetical protein